MKKYLFTGLIALAILPGISFAQVSDTDTSATPSCAIISVNLRYLSRDVSTNGAVSVLQDFLQSHGYLNSQPTGFFGSMTRSAVSAFQKANGISATPPGFVGSVTRAKIQEVDCSGTVGGTAGTTTDSSATIAPTGYSLNVSAFYTPSSVSKGVAHTVLVYTSSNAQYCEIKDAEPKYILFPKYSLFSSPENRKRPSSGQEAWDGILTTPHVYKTQVTCYDASGKSESQAATLTVTNGSLSEIPKLNYSSGTTFSAGDFVSLYGSNIEGGTVIIDGKDLGVYTKYNPLFASLGFLLPTNISPGVHTVYVQQQITGKPSNSLTFTISSPVTTAPPPTVTAYFSPATITTGLATSQLVYTSTNASSCTISNPDLDRVFTVPDKDNQPTSGTEIAGPFSSAQTYMRVVGCFSSSGRADQSATLSVVDPLQVPAAQPPITSVPMPMRIDSVQTLGTGVAQYFLPGATVTVLGANLPNPATITIGTLKITDGVSTNADASRITFVAPLTLIPGHQIMTVTGASGQSQNVELTVGTVKIAPLISPVILPSSSLMAGINTISKFKIANSATTGGMTWKNFSFVVVKSAGVTLEGPSVMQLRDSLGNIVGGTFAIPYGNLSSGSTSATVTFTANVGQNISTSETYILTDSVSGTLITGASVSTVLTNPDTGSTLDSQTLTVF